jgi:CRISPR-associated exonuclease Cas4
MTILYLSILLVVIAIGLFILAARQRRKTGLPAGNVIYIDTRNWGKLEKPLYDPGLRLTGKPDYLVQQGDRVIPVEVKSRAAPPNPYDSHIYQVAAYCLLVDHVYGQRPTQGIIHYSDKTFAIDFTPELEVAVKATVVEMQERTNSTEVTRSHQDGKRCQRCGYRSVCDQALRI